MSFDEEYEGEILYKFDFGIKFTFLLTKFVTFSSNLLRLESESHTEHKSRNGIL